MAEVGVADRGDRVVVDGQVARRSDQRKLNARPGEEAAQSDDERRHTDKDGDRPLQ